MTARAGVQHVQDNAWMYPEGGEDLAGGKTVGKKWKMSMKGGREGEGEGGQKRSDGRSVSKLDEREGVL